jgi:7,8-dihydropterin-6-yl-methyl-4-(beta-D-ribofuranosyl)aminobenzene 5'-phosphate synthase
MIIRALVENRSIDDDWKHEHGFSLAIETNHHHLLFDLGASDALLDNALQAGIDLNDIDIAFISHGHYDHAGGLKSFLSTNQHAPIYITHSTFEKHFSKQNNGEYREIGIDASLYEANRFIKYDYDHLIDDELIVFSHVKQKMKSAITNQNLYKKTDDRFVLDDFNHEQHLIIESEGKKVLIAGCAHQGILNIVERAKTIINRYPDIVIGGFHLYSQSSGESETDEYIQTLAKGLLATKAVYYTGHCTGFGVYNKMKALMKDQLLYFAAGNILLL